MTSDVTCLRGRRGCTGLPTLWARSSRGALRRTWTDSANWWVPSGTGTGWNSSPGARCMPTGSSAPGRGTWATLPEQSTLGGELGSGFTVHLGSLGGTAGSLQQHQVPDAVGRNGGPQLGAGHGLISETRRKEAGLEIPPVD